jgi:hypothetical protein
MAASSGAARVRSQVKREPWPWAALGVTDPRPWLLECDEPAARWVTLTGVLDRPAGDPEVAVTHRAVVADAGTRALLDRIPDWTAGEGFSGHDSPQFAPNLVGLLFDSGIEAGDDPRIGRLLDQMLDHQDADGRFPSFAAERRGEQPLWGALLCDSHAVLDVLVRAGRAGHPKVRAGLNRLSADLTRTAQGTVIPRSAYQGFTSFSFGQKKKPSGFAAARLLAVLHRFDDLADAAATVDVTALRSSRGGTGTALPPGRERRPPEAGGAHVI